MKRNAAKDLLEDILLMMEHVLVNVSNGVQHGNPEKWKFVLACVLADLEECLAMVLIQRFKWEKDKSKTAVKRILEGVRKERRTRR